MAALASALAPSLASEYQVNNSWITQDANPTGKNPISTGPVEPIDDPVNGTATVDLSPSPFNWVEPELASAAPDYFYESAFSHAGPWPSLPEAYDGKEPFGTIPADGITPAGYYKIPPKLEGLAQTETFVPGHDRHSQDVDNAGWQQLTPSGRTGVRQYWAQHYPGVDNFWPVTQPNQARVKVALGGNQEINGVVAEYGGIYGSGGNTAYTTPEPTPTTTQAPNPGSSSIPQWGF